MANFISTVYDANNLINQLWLHILYCTFISIVFLFVIACNYWIWCFFFCNVQKPRNLTLRGHVLSYSFLLFLFWLCLFIVDTRGFFFLRFSNVLHTENVQQTVMKLFQHAYTIHIIYYTLIVFQPISPNRIASHLCKCVLQISFYFLSYTTSTYSGSIFGEKGGGSKFFQYLL